MVDTKPLVMVCANQAWNLYNFRAGLIRALLAAGYRVLAVAPPDPVWEPRLESLGCSFAPLVIDSAGMSPVRDVRLLLEIVRLMRHHRPVAWLSWTIKPNCYGALAARWCGVASFPNVSGLGTAFITKSLLTRLVRLLYRISFRRCATVFFQNADDRALFVDSRLTRADQAQQLPGSGVDLDYFSPPHGARPACGNFMMIARLLADKGVREFVAAAASLRAELPSARFTIVGDVGVANRTAISAAELRGWLDAGIIAWQPAVADIRPIIAAADWIVLPSYREGASRVLLEAGAMGRPTVTTRVPGCQDIVEDGNNGLLCLPRDSTSLAAALHRAIMMADDEWQAMAARARAHVVANYSESIIAQRYLDAVTAVHSGAN